MKDVKNKLCQYFKQRGAGKYLLALNDKILRMQRFNEHGDPVPDTYDNLYIGYDVLTKELQIGIYHRRDKFNTVFEPREEQLQGLCKALKNNVLFGQQDWFTPEQATFSIDVDVDLGIANIKQDIFYALVDPIYIKDIQGTLTLSNGTVISNNFRDALYNYFDNHFLDAYLTLYQVKLSKYLKRVSKTYSELKFITAAKTYVFPIIKNRLFICPFLDCARYKEILSKTKLMQCMLNHHLEVKGLQVYPILRSEACESLNFTGKVKLTSLFLVYLLLGIFNDGYPTNRTSHHYIPGNPSSLKTTAQYNRLPIEERSAYVNINILLDLCNRYAITQGFNSGEALYASIRDLRLREADNYDY